MATPASTSLLVAVGRLSVLRLDWSRRLDALLYGGGSWRLIRLVALFELFAGFLAGVEEDGEGGDAAGGENGGDGEVQLLAGRQEDDEHDDAEAGDDGK